MDDKRRPPRVIFSFLSIGRLDAPMNLIIDHFGSSLQVFAGRFATDRSIRTLGPADLPLRTLPTYSYRDKIVFQIVPFNSYLRADVLVADLNPPSAASVANFGGATLTWKAHRLMGGGLASER